MVQSIMRIDRGIRLFAASASGDQYAGLASH
jgi:hypothetical protein